jgi:hypothetical protein
MAQRSPETRYSLTKGQAAIVAITAPCILNSRSILSMSTAVTLGWN